MTLPDDSPTASDRTRRLLRRLADGDDSIQDDLLQLVHDELHAIARRLMAQQSASHTLQPTALVHEAWLKLVGTEDANFESRTHFVRVAARAMRSVLVDHARARRAERRNRGQKPLTLAIDPAAEETDLERVLAVHEALEVLAERDPQLASLVELRFFGGLGNAEIAAALGTSLRSTERNWRLAKAWLHGLLSERDA